MNTKTIHTDQGTFIVDEELEQEFDPASMLPDDSGQFYAAEEPQKPVLDVVVVNGQRFLGRLKTYKTTVDGITGKTIVRLVLEA